MTSISKPGPSVRKRTKDLGEILIQRNQITSAELEAATLEKTMTDTLLGRVLLQMGMVKESDLMAALAEQVGYRFVDLSDPPVDASAAAPLPEPVARLYRAIREIQNLT